MDTGAIALQATGLSRSFGATKALVEANFTVRAGTAHALLGENGAGKSTTIKLLSGMLRPDAGAIRVFGETVAFGSPRDAQRAGLQTAFQELTLAPDLTVVQNMVLGYEPLNAFGRIDHKAARHSVTSHFADLGIVDIDPRADVRQLSLNQRQRLEIARALFRRPRVLFLDEATSTLSAKDVEWLDGIVRRLKTQGLTVVMITHKMQEVRQFCDHVTVLRNGRDVGSFSTQEVTDDQLVELIIGRSLDATFPPKGHVPTGTSPLLSVRNLATERRLVDCSFDLYPGEIVGVAALQGMGQSELFNALFGAIATKRGTITYDGKSTLFGTPQQAINAGLALVPEERKTEGLFLELTGRENIAMPVVDRLTRFCLIDGDREARIVNAIMGKVQVDSRALYTRAAAFSGGNQQKMVLAKWLLTKPRALLLFDPCRGVDVGTKHEIYMLINEFAEAGGAVLLYSSETPELVNLSHRIVVLYEGRLTQIASGPGNVISEKAVMTATLGALTAKTVEHIA